MVKRSLTMSFMLKKETHGRPCHEHVVAVEEKRE